MTDHEAAPDKTPTGPISRAKTPDELLDAPMEHAKYVLEQAAKSTRAVTRNKSERLRIALVDLAEQVRKERAFTEAEQAYLRAKQALRRGDTEPGVADG